MGCLIDYSHGPATGLDRAILELAASLGYRYVSDWPDGTPLSEDNDDYGMILSELADEAVAWMNDRLDDTFLVVEDNSMFHYYVDED
jgi:hypothetical protein